MHSVSHNNFANTFRSAVIKWSLRHPRDFPWRETRDPYQILMSEIMLRRTRADQVAPVFLQFIGRFSDIYQLAAASAAEIATVVYSLGLHWRAPAFQAAAVAVVERYGGTVPQDPIELRTLPGVGGYVAAAVMAFAFDRPAALVDTNTVRVAGRYFGLPLTAESRRNRNIRAHVALLFDPLQPRLSGRAVLDFAALVCRAKQPQCQSCPLTATCAYFQAHA